MEKIAYSGRLFLGVVKFFDSSKGFGFIASNHCGMPLHSAYKQDFYVNSESFAEEEAKAEGRIVVFQILEQRKGREKAINVRSITKSDEDIQLVLSYYGEYEKVEINDGRIINLYDFCFRPRKLIAQKVIGIIQKDKERSPETTFKHVEFFLKHYKVGTSIKEKFVFDRDFEKEEKQIWVDFFAIFTNEEWLEILKAYPSACRYVTSDNVFEKWIENIDFGHVDDYLPTNSNKRRSRSYDIYGFIEYQRKLIEYKDILELLPLPYRAKCLTRFQKFVDQVITKTIHWVLENDYTFETSVLDDSIARLLRLTPNKHEQEIENARECIRNKCIIKEFHRYFSFPSERNARMVNQTLNHISDAQKDACLKEIMPSMLDFINEKIDEDKLEIVIDTLNAFTFIGEEFRSSISNRLIPILEEKFCCSIRESIENKTGLTLNFKNTYLHLTKLFDKTIEQRLRSEIVKLMHGANNIEMISNCSSGRNNVWLTTEEAHLMAEAIVKEWKYEDFSNFFRNNFSNNYSSTELFTRTEDLCMLIADYAFKLIKAFSLSEFFDGSPAYTAECNQQTPFGNIWHNRRSAEAENIKFLEHLIKLLPNGKKHPLWQTYINERSNIDLLVLYDKGLVDTLPLNIIEDVVNEITLDNVLADKERWYTRPILPDGPIKKILTNADDSLFAAIAKRLTTLSLTESDIPLAVLLIELMKINKPNDMKDWEEREWDRVFAQRLKAFRASLPSDSKLAVLLWAVHFQSSGSMALLRDFFHLLPPYVQIRVVKRLFSAIATGKFMQTAASLYELIGGDIHQICFPLEIVFAYLMRREKDPSATLDNNIMLSLLDGREDHPEWIGIRQMITECYGRWQVYELPDNRSNYKRGSFFNGIIKEGQDNKLIVFVPNKMVDEHGNIQNYNNKYYTDIQELIKISYDDSEYQKATIQNGIEYIFNQSYKIDLFSVARAYNLKYNRLNNYVGFEKKENENDVFCECRVADALDNWFGISFYWCGNRPCFRQPIRFMLDSEWERYTILDFMRILHIPTDYINQKGKVIRYGHYIILSAYLKGFAKFYEHLKCRECGKLMKPLHITNFASRAVNQFQCADERCSGHGEIVYLNHCFNKQKCNATIDSRDSKQCPNDQYICSECGACCSTENFQRRISHLQMTGGDISRRLIEFVQYDLGHWEKHEFYCYKCGKPMTNINGHYYCADCGSEYNHQ